MSVARPGLEDCLHRLANYVECRLVEIVPQLIAESRSNSALDLMREGCGLVEVLREICDGKEGGEE